MRHEKEMASIAANSQQAAMPPSQNGVTSIIIGPKFANLDMRTLKEYQKAFDLDVPQNISKTDLVDAINRHFAKSPKLREIEVVATFLQRLKQDKELESSDVQ